MSVGWAEFGQFLLVNCDGGLSSIILRIGRCLSDVVVSLFHVGAELVLLVVLRVGYNIFVFLLLREGSQILWVLSNVREQFYS